MNKIKIKIINVIMLLCILWGSIAIGSIASTFNEITLEQNSNKESLDDTLFDKENH